jgi:hypothetical protein
MLYKDLMASSDVSVRLPSSLPQELRFPTPSKAVAGESMKLRIAADKPEVRTKSSNQFRITIPNSASLWEARNSRLCFDLIAESSSTWAQIAVDPGAMYAINKNISSIFRRVRILSGSKEIVNLENYNLLSNILSVCGANDDYNNTIGDIQSNTGTLEERAKYIKKQGDGTISSFPTRRFCMCLHGTNLLENTLPLFVSQPWIIEFTLAPLAEFLEYQDTLKDGPTNAGTTDKIDDILLTNIYFHTKVLTLSSELELQMRNTFANNVKTYAFTAYDHFSQISAGKSHQIQIPTKKSVVSGILCVQRDASDAVTLTQLDKLNGKYLYNGLEQYQYVINGKNHPADPVECLNGGAEMLQELTEFFDKQRLTVGSTTIKEDNWTVGAAYETAYKEMTTIIAMDMRKFSTSLVSGENTAQSVGSLIFKARTADVSATDDHPDNTFDFFVRHTSLLQVVGGRVDVVH